MRALLDRKSDAAKIVTRVEWHRGTPHALLPVTIKERLHQPIYENGAIAASGTSHQICLMGYLERTGLMFPSVM